ncbi:MAG: SPOR domain-containing protein [Bacteroidota bacterium]|nr:SPOR domain-containing protein [Bacteroidota bacterium]
MELAICIKNLLYNHDIVIIPGLGGLVTQYRPAEIKLSDNIITPPTKHLTFDSKLLVSDGLLSGYIATIKKIGLKEAEAVIAEDVLLINKQLKEQGIYQLEGIGILIKKEEDILFSQDNNINYLSDTYGLPSINIKQHKEEAPAIKFEFKEEPAIHHRKSRKGLWITTSIVLLLAGGGAGVYFLCPNIVNNILYKPKQPVVAEPQPVKQQEQQVKTTSKDTAKSGDLEEYFDNATDKKKALAIKSDTSSKSKDNSKPKPQNNKPATQPKVQTQPAKIQPLPAESKVQQSSGSGGSYYIIAGSFKTAKKAGILVKELEAEGFKAEVVQFGEETYRVSLGQFKDKAKANAETEKIKAKGKEVWLVPNKHKKT